MMIHVRAFFKSFGVKTFQPLIWSTAMYSTLCYIKADTAKLCASLEPQVGLATYYEMTFDVVLSLGLTELKAHVCWQENVSFLRICYHHPTFV